MLWSRCADSELIRQQDTSNQEFLSVKNMHAAQLRAEDVHQLTVSAVRDSHEAIITMDERETIVMINPAAQRMFGYSAAEALGSGLARLIPLRCRAADAQRLTPFGASGAIASRTGESCRVSGLHAQGQEFPLSVKICCVDLPGTEVSPRLYSVLLTDLSSAQRLQNEIEAQRQQLQRIFEVAPIAILITAGERTVFANPAFLHLVGAIDLELVKGKSVYEFFNPTSHAALQGRITRAVAGELEAGSVLNERLRRCDGSLRGVEIAVVALPGMSEGSDSTVQLVITDITQREKASEELLRSRQELRRLSGSLVDAREEERRRIARELHDELGQRLSALKMDLTSLGHELHGRASQQRQFDMLKTLDDTVAAVRHLAADLRPLMLDDLGLNAAIEWLARESARRMNLEITVQLDEVDPPLNHRVATALYRMVQEALTNVARHARASKVQINLLQQDVELQLTVRDNGIGLPAMSARSDTSFGLLGMRERAILLGGQMSIASPPDGGCLVTVQLPLRLSDKLPGHPEDTA